MTIFIASRPHLMNVAQELTIITVILACLVCEPTFTYNVVHCYLPQFSCKKATSLYLDSGKNGWIFRSKYVKSAIFRWIYKEVLSINLKLVARKKGLFQNAFKHLSICGKITFDAILQMIGFCAIGFFRNFLPYVQERWCGTYKFCTRLIFDAKYECKKF